MASRRGGLWTVRFKVSGKGRFPLDMLRYDKCFPVTEGDACRLTDRVDRDVRVLELEHRCDNRQWTPKIDRWASFGWTVVETVQR